MRGKLSIGTLVTVTMASMAFLGYFYTQITSKFDSVYADYQSVQEDVSKTNSNLAAAIQHNADIDKNIDQINMNIANLQSQNGQILDIIRNK